MWNKSMKNKIYADMEPKRNLEIGNGHHIRLMALTGKPCLERR